jgi:hypothetical protein
MSVFDDIKKYLPKYLSAEATKELFSDIENFPDNLKRIYSNSLVGETEIFQGDGLRDIPVIKLPDKRIKIGPVIVISNTCDTSPSNKRWEIPKLIYCPITKLTNYVELLKKKSIPEDRIQNRIADIRKQYVSTIFYLPKGANLPDECVALLDSVNSCDVSILNPQEIGNKRLFSLSNYGFYVFLLKLSIHFTRIRETINRG